MGTVITGVFRDHMSALKAAVALESAGFQRSHMRVVDSTTPDRRAFVQRRVADTKRAVLIGMTLGPVLGAIAGLTLAGVFETAATILAGALGGILGGCVLGLLVGRVTTTQMAEELENRIEDGAVVIRLFVEQEQLEKAQRILAEHSEAQFTASVATFTGGVFSPTHHEAAQPVSRRAP